MFNSDTHVNSVSHKKSCRYIPEKQQQQKQISKSTETGFLIFLMQKQ